MGSPISLIVANLFMEDLEVHGNHDLTITPSALEKVCG